MALMCLQEVCDFLVKYFNELCSCHSPVNVPSASMCSHWVFERTLLMLWCWSSPRGQNEVVVDDDTCYEYGLSMCNVWVPIWTSPTGPCAPSPWSVVPTLESPLRNVNVCVCDPNSPIYEHHSLTHLLTYDHYHITSLNISEYILV